MSQESERFLQAEQSAQQLLKALEDLKNEAVSYNTCTKELEAVRVNLVGLISSMQMIAKDTSEVINVIKGIGGPEILKLLGSLSKKVQTESESTHQRIDRLRVLTIVGISISIVSLAGIVVLLMR